MKITQNKYEWAVANLKEFAQGVENKSGDLNEKAAIRLGLSPEQLQQKSRNGKKSYVVISEWSRTLLKDRGLIVKSERGAWSLTQKGVELRNISIEELKLLPNLSSNSDQMNYLNQETLSELLEKIKFKESTPTPRELTNLIFNTLALAKVSKAKSVEYIDLKPNTGAHRQIFTSEYESLAAIDPNDKDQGTISSFGVWQNGFETDMTPPRQFLSSRLLSAIKRRGDSINPPGFILRDMKLKIEDDLSSFRDALSKLKDEDARSALGIFALRSTGTDGNQALTKETAAQTLTQTYGEAGSILSGHINASNFSTIDVEQLVPEPAEVKEFKAQKSDTQKRLILALSSKPFVILAGGTGTGKTKCAIELARKVCRKQPQGEPSDYEVIAVGADWTDTRPLLGYENILTEPPKYTVPKALDLIIRASRNIDRPHFLILDEMNLSHVERYFSDFLSLMEAKKIDEESSTIKLHAQNGFMTSTNGNVDGQVPHRIAWPGNLFVIGTVNIDETTHMFSPKVLDRAHVIEFKPQKAEIEIGLDESWTTTQQDKKKRNEEADNELGTWGITLSGFMLKNRDEKIFESIKHFDDGEKNIIKQRIMGAWELLRKTRFSFSHRTAQEIADYVFISRNLCSHNGDKLGAPPGLTELIDLAFLQKLLPKINGSAETLSARIEEDVEKKPAQSSLLDSLIQEFGEKSDKGLGRLSNCIAKLEEMKVTLEREHFVSFIQ